MASLWEAYRDATPGYDETRDERGTIRPCWSRFFDRVAGIDEVTLAQLQATANRQLQEHGATFHLHASGDTDVHPWRLDPIPLLIDQAEWQSIDTGLQQRARLLSRVLADLYGPQEFIRSGLIPQDLILRHPGFQRACWNATEPGPFTLFQYAADLARGPGGAMWVVNDRTGIPPGAGYALENRTIMARLFPDEIRHLQVHRLSGSFRAFRAGLRAVAPHAERQPRIVFYTPGPYSPAYFEHAFLAAYLGYTLVQGNDLLVRDGRVWLKALEGLQAVDVIIRRVTDPFCDPLELHEDSQLGVPGLVEAVRRRTVSVVNQIGSHVLENPGLMPFLPGLAKEVLGEELILPTAATWWCGQPAEKHHVLEHLDQLVIKTIDRKPVQQADGLGPYTEQERAELQAAIGAEPWRFIGQERIGFSSIPVLEQGRLEPRAMSLRVFVTYDGSNYHVMPGGLTRCGDPGQTYLPANQIGGICKDTWVLAPEPVAFNSLWLEQNENGRDAALTGLFTSNAVENLFWAGRYAERAEGLVQTIQVLLQVYEQSQQSPGDARQQCLQNLWLGLLAQAGVGEAEPDAQPQPSLESIARFAMGPDTTGSIPQALNGFINAAFFVRENWSMDTWRIINRIRDLCENTPHSVTPNVNELLELLDTKRLLLQAFHGQCAESMTRTAGWLFLGIGSRVEHGISMTNLLTGALRAPREDLTEYYLLEALLEANESLVTYRRTYRTTPSLGDVLGLLLTQPKNPRSLLFQLQDLHRLLQTLGNEIELPAIRPLLESLTAAVAELENAYQNGQLPRLLALLHDVRTNLLVGVSEALSNAFFKHAKVRPQPLVVTPQFMT